MKLKSYFFEVTKKATKRGNRFLNGDRPDETTFRELVDSVTFKTEVNDLAKEYDSTKKLEELSGLGIAATNTNAKSYLDKVYERIIFVQPHQLPQVTNVEGDDLVFDSQDYVVDYSGFNVDVSIDTVSENSDKRNIFNVKLTTSFTTWLRNSLNNIQNIIVDILNQIQDLNTRVTAVEEALGTVSGGTIDITEFLPVGTYLSYSGSIAPNSKFLKADGAAVSRTTYSALFAVIGATYGAGDGTTTFNLPNASDRFLRYNTGSIGTLDGSDTVMLAGNQLPLHKHSVDANGANIEIGISGDHNHQGFRYGNADTNQTGASIESWSLGGPSTATSATMTKNAGNHDHTINGETGFQGNYTQQPVGISPKSLSATLWIKAL
jgi:microcystin-dependent protein